MQTATAVDEPLHQVKTTAPLITPLIISNGRAPRKVVVLSPSKATAYKHTVSTVDDDDVSSRLSPAK
jgi:hypothetical protein